MSKNQAPITKSEICGFECGREYWRTLKLLQPSTQWRGELRETDRGEMYRAISAKRNTVYIMRTYTER